MYLTVTDKGDLLRKISAYSERGTTPDTPSGGKEQK